MYDQDAYLRDQVATATPAMLIAMLYDGIVANTLFAALESFAANEPIAARRPLMKAQDIVLELRTSLDKEHGGEIASNLDRLYAFMYQKLLDASIRGEAPAAEVVVRLTTTFRDAWKDACLPQPVARPS